MRRKRESVTKIVITGPRQQSHLVMTLVLASFVKSMVDRKYGSGRQQVFLKLSALPGCFYGHEGKGFQSVIIFQSLLLTLPYEAES